MLDEELVDKLFSTEVNAFFVEDDNIYVLIGSKVEVLPNTSHNKELCTMAIKNKLDYVQHVNEELKELKTSKNIIKKLAYYGGLVHEKESIEYVTSLEFVSSHLEEINETLQPVIINMIPMEEETKEMKSNLSLGNLFVIDPPHIIEYAKTMQKVIKTTAAKGQND